MTIGQVVRKVSMARWSRTLSTLIAAGVDIVNALDITALTAGNWVVENETMRLRIRVQEGATIAQPLIDSAVFPPMVSQMVKIGEESGELEKMLGKVADFYEDEVDASIQSLTSIIEPLMMIAVGFMVGIIVIACTCRCSRCSRSSSSASTHTLPCDRRPGPVHWGFGRPRSGRCQILGRLIGDVRPKLLTGGDAPCSRRSETGKLWVGVGTETEGACSWS